jgi:hypothetical protein
MLATLHITAACIPIWYLQMKRLEHTNANNLNHSFVDVKMKLGLSCYGKNTDWGSFRIGFWRECWDLREKKWQKGGENCTLSSIKSSQNTVQWWMMMTCEARSMYVCDRYESYTKCDRDRQTGRQWWKSELLKAVPGIIVMSRRLTRSKYNHAEIYCLCPLHTNVDFCNSLLSF